MDKVFKDLKNFIHNNEGTWDTSNYGALMIAAGLEAFDNLAKRSVANIMFH